MAFERTDARPDPPTDARPDSSTGARIDPERVRRQLRCQTERIQRREVEEAVSKLEARGDLTDEQRETVRHLGAALRRRITARPEAALERSGPGDATVRSLARLFDADGEAAVSPDE